MNKYILKTFILIGLIFISSCEKEDMPKSDFEASSYSVFVNETITFTNNSISAKSYKWLFGDGTESLEMAPSHSYPEPGAYEVVLIAYSESGKLGNDLKKTITVNVFDPDAYFTANYYTVAAGTEVKFTNTSTNCLRYEWKFGDGTQSTDKNPTHTFSNAGVYTVELKVYTLYDLKSDSYTRSITVTNGNAFYDGFEPYTDFTKTIGIWKQYDFDNLYTIGFADYDFTNENYKGSFIVFNPATTTPSLSSSIPSKEGNKYAASFGTYGSDLNPAAHDDWLVTPSINCGFGFKLTFWARSNISSSSVYDKFDITVSTVTVGAPPSWFTVKSTVTATTSTWTEYSLNLGDYVGQTIRIGIHVYSDPGSFVFMLDDFFVAEASGNQKVLDDLRVKYSDLNQELAVTNEKTFFISVKK